MENYLQKFQESNEKDVDLAVEAAKKGFEEFKHTSVTQRSALLNKIADIVEANLETLAVAETLDNGKAVRETFKCRFTSCLLTILGILHLL